MKPKLKTFSDFVKQLMPLEIAYLQSVEQFKDVENVGIFQQIVKFKDTGKLKLDVEIDKRKYSGLKKWIEQKLALVDVDKMLDELSDLDRKVMRDVVLPSDEKKILKIIKTQTDLPFYFMRIYEMARDYQSFLLVRMRHQYLTPVKMYLDENLEKYNHSREIFDKLNEATRDIIDQYSQPLNDTLIWEDFLKAVFFDENLDGLNRYSAIVRLTFLYYNYNELSKIEMLYDYLDSEFERGRFYSRRILSNYYSNRLILHAKMNNLEAAEKYGYLSLRDESSDFVHYLNNLCSVLLRRKKNEAALALMQKSIPELKKTMSYHNRVGFASLLIKSLNANGKAVDGESYGTTFFNVYKDKVLLYRWHSFFSAWLQSMILQEKYRVLLTICRRYKIMDKEQEYSSRPGYVPTIAWYYLLSKYKTGEIDIEKFKLEIVKSRNSLVQKAPASDLLVEIGAHVPELLGLKF